MKRVGQAELDVLLEVAESSRKSTMSAMARDVKELIREATELSEADRATLAGVMIESLDPQPTDAVKNAWSREIERRVREIEDGSVDLIDWENIRAELFAE